MCDSSEDGDEMEMEGREVEIEVRLFFINRVTVPRLGKTRADFANEFTADEARTQLALKKVPHTLVEFLSCPDGDPRQCSPGKFYLDRDVYVGPNPPSDELMAFHLREVLEKVQIIIEILTRDGVHLSFKIATRHGFCLKRNEHKLSYRPFILGISIRYTDIPQVIEHVEQCGFWDMSVYKPFEQLLATINGCKGMIGGVYDARILTPASPDDDSLDYVVQHVDRFWPFLDMPPPSDSMDEDEVDDEEGERVTSARVSIQGSIDCPEYIRDLLACLSRQTSDDRSRWVRIGYLLKSYDQGNHDYWAD